MDDLINLLRLFDGRQLPVAYVISRQVEAAIYKHIPWKPGTTHSPFGGVPVYVFRDVPQQEGVIFYDWGALREYAVLREKIGHAAAMLRLQAYVEAGLIQAATIRALLETA